MQTPTSRRSSAGRSKACRRTPGPGSPRPRATGPSTGIRRAQGFTEKARHSCAGRGVRRCGPPRCADRGRGGGDAPDPGRPAPADLHVLPPGARARGGRGADAADAGWPDDAGDRERVPRPGADARPAARPCQEEDPRGRHRVRGAVRGSPGRPAGRGAPGPVPRVQRGLRRHRRRGADPPRAVRRGDPAGPHRRRSCSPASPRRRACWP